MKRPRPRDQSDSTRLRKQKQSDTKPERFVRQLLHKKGYRYRTSNRDLPGSPDIANRSRRWAVFVHGCFWHHHEGCAHATIPKSNKLWWTEKFKANRARDIEKARLLRAIGYRVVVVWECELHDPNAVTSHLVRQLAPQYLALRDRSSVEVGSNEKAC